MGLGFSTEQKRSNLTETIEEMLSAASDFDPFATGEVALAVPVSESQQEIWAAAQMGDEANCAYNESQSLILRGALDVAALQTALQRLVRRHEALRTTFSSDGATLCISDTLTCEIPLTDLTGASAQERDRQVQNLTRQAVETPFNLQFGPLFRAHIIKLQPTEHLLLMTVHHVVCDGWSWAVLLPDLGTLYTALSQGTVPELDDPEPFSTYALQQAAAIAEPETLATEAYWLAQFSDSIPQLDLPTDRPRPPLRTFDSAREDWALDPALVKSLKQLGMKLKCSFMTTLLSSFEVFLHRITGQDDVIVGVPAAGQAATGQYALVGHCVNLLPLRSQVNPTQSFSDYLQMRRSQVLDAYDHQQFTFGRLVAKLPITRDPSRIPLVSVLFNIDQGLDTQQLPFAGLGVELFSNPRSYENFEWFINATELAGNLTLECQYNTNLFDAATMRRRLAEFETLLMGIVANPNQQIAAIPLLPTAERQILKDWNTTPANYPAVCIHQLFETQVTASPSTVAVVFEGQSLTYESLNTQANQLAHYLQSLGVGPDSLVGICVERSLNMVVGLLAILKAGGSYVPLDPAYPQDRLDYMIEDSQLSILLTQVAYRQQFATQTVQMICVDADQSAIAQQPSTNPSSGVTPDHLAYTIYTSGSTGKPKGVQICHGTAVNFLASMQRAPGLTSADTLLAITTISFDIAVLELYLPLTVGARIVLAPQGVTTDASRLLQLLTTSGITLMQATPVTWRMLMEVGWTGNPHLKMLCGGEAMSSELAKQLLARGGSLWNMYGPTETTVWSSVCQIQPEAMPITIGTPIANTQLEVLDTQYQPMPIGVPGELYIGGAGLARGYLNRPDLTMDRFIITAEGDRLYKTGDLARWLPTGQVECLGRTDYQVKVRGFRIELGEIEAALGQHPAVQQCAVIDREDTPGDKRLVAYIVTPVTDTPTALDLRQFLRQTLPEYMLPSAFVTMPTLPLTPNGKVNRRALPEPERTNVPPPGDYIAPRSPLEQQLSEIWAAVLQLEQVGIYDNFFDLGGQSILAIRLSTQIEKKVGQRFPITLLLQAPTIAEQARLLGDPAPTAVESQPTLNSHILANQSVVNSGAANPVAVSPDSSIQTAKASSQPSNNLVLLRAGGNKPPLFCIYGILLYRQLADCLDPDRPVYAVYLQEEVDLILTGQLDAEGSIFKIVSTISGRYLEEIRSQQPHGPYYLAGESFGGVIAFEIAHQLQAAGEVVNLVTLLDSEFPNSKSQMPLFQKLQLHWQLFRAQGVSYAAEKTQKFTNAIRFKTVDLLQRTFLRSWVNEHPLSDAELAAAQLNIQELSRRRALANYVPKPYSGPIALFRAMERNLFDVSDSGQEWKTVATGNFHVFDVPGDHLGILRDPNVRILGAELNKYLETSGACQSNLAIDITPEVVEAPILVAPR